MHLHRFRYLFGLFTLALALLPRAAGAAGGPVFIFPIADQTVDRGETLSLSFPVDTKGLNYGTEASVLAIVGNPALIRDGSRFIMVSGWATTDATIAQVTLDIDVGMIVGSTVITVQSFNAIEHSAHSASFTLTIGGPHTAPTLSPIADQRVRTDQSLDIGFDVVDDLDARHDLHVSATADAASLLGTMPFTFTVRESESTAVLSVQAGSIPGVTTITITATDSGGAAASTRFDLTIEPTNLLGNPSFEATTLSPWFCNYCTLQPDTASGPAPVSGSIALAITQRLASWSGPNYPVTDVLVSGRSYLSSAWVRTATPGSVARVVLQVTEDNADPVWYVSADVPLSSAWSQVRAAWTPRWNGNLDKVLWYVEVIGPNNSSPDFMVDQVSLTVAPQPERENLFGNGEFTAVTPDPWNCRFGPCELAVQDAGPGHETALRVSGRAQPWSGPAQDITNVLQPTTPYHASIAVRQPVGSAPTLVRMFMYVRETSGHERYYLMGQAMVGAGWTILAGSAIPVGTTEVAEAIWYLDSTAGELIVDTAQLSPVPAVAE